METLLTLLYLASGILGIIFFSKIWRACNAIQRLAEKYASKDEIKKIRAKERTKSGRLETREDIDNWLKEGEDKDESN